MRSKRRALLALGILLGLVLFGCQHVGNQGAMERAGMESSMPRSGAAMKSESMRDSMQGSTEVMKNESMKSTSSMPSGSMNDGGMQKPMDHSKPDTME